MNRHYRCAENSVVGQRIGAFWRKAHRAACRAEAYAKSMGAASYIQPVQYFEGGVDFLEFDGVPDSEVWRKKDLGAEIVYEPNCNTRTGVLILDEGEDFPKDTWDRIYNKARRPWSQIASLRPLSYWAMIADYPLTGDKNEDVLALDALMRGKTFITYIEFYGDQPLRRGKVPVSLRKAIKAERLRMSLPVVKAEEFFAILAMESSSDKGVMGRFLETPVFFKYNLEYYIKVCGECRAEGLEEIDVVQFNVKKNEALRAANEN